MAAERGLGIGCEVARMARGIGMQVIACDQDTGMFASRLWWLLRWMGHEEIAVLDGGLAKWLAEGRPTASGEESRAGALRNLRYSDALPSRTRFRAGKRIAKRDR